MIVDVLDVRGGRECTGEIGVGWMAGDDSHGTLVKTSRTRPTHELCSVEARSVVGSITTDTEMTMMGGFQDEQVVITD